MGIGMWPSSPAIPTAPLTMCPSLITPPPNPVPTIAETELCAGLAPCRMWWAYRAAALPSLLYRTGMPSRSSSAALMLNLDQSG